MINVFISFVFGVLLGGVAALGYFQYTGSTINFTKKK